MNEKFDALYAAFEKLEEACGMMYELVLQHNYRISELEEALKKVVKII